eukprot:TRINITY_DN65327_c0_g1_i1.p1 TRINITY_DN65327_c0_g1~~TRINITY_DN65327_c0_g1_i1.p1  ORF type:complete len:235 (-),score=37.25 TRINITY_DN65327_c0_g1_i1:56-760(-)
MIASLDLEGIQGPPPQAVLDKRPWWLLLLVLLSLTAVVRLATLDIIGALLTVMVLFLASMMIADGMADMPRYAMAFSLLCFLCLFFDLVPLLACLGGKSEVTVEPEQRTVNGNELRITYTTVIKTSPFFDSSQGFMYNGDSLAMILSPVSLSLGAYLSAHAHHAMHAATVDFDEGRQRGDREGAMRGARDRQWEALGRRNVGNGGRTANPEAVSIRPAEVLLRFTGRSHRLDSE